MFPDYFVDRNASAIQMGYVSPGHGVRGKQQWLSNDKTWMTCMKNMMARRSLFGFTNQRKKTRKERGQHTHL